MYFKVDDQYMKRVSLISIILLLHNAILPLILLSGRTGKNAKGKSLLLLCVNVKYIAKLILALDKGAI